MFIATVLLSEALMGFLLCFNEVSMRCSIVFPWSFLRFQCGFHVVSMWFPLGFHGVSMWFPSSSHGKSLSHHQVVLRSVESTSEMSTEAGASGPDGTHPIYGHHFGECLVVFHDLIWEKKEKTSHYCSAVLTRTKTPTILYSFSIFN